MRIGPGEWVIRFRCWAGCVIVVLDLVFILDLRELVILDPFGI